MSWQCKQFSTNNVVLLHHNLRASDVCVVPLDLLVISAAKVSTYTFLTVPLCVRNVFARIIFRSQHALEQAATLLDHKRGAFLPPIALGLGSKFRRNGRDNHSNNWQCPLPSSELPDQLRIACIICNTLRTGKEHTASLLDDHLANV